MMDLCAHITYPNKWLLNTHLCLHCVQLQATPQGGALKSHFGVDSGPTFISHRAAHLPVLEGGTDSDTGSHRKNQELLGKVK